MFLQPPAKHLERRESTRNRLRFYTIAVTRTLFDGWALVREWGRFGRPGTVRETWFASEHPAVTASASLRRRKERRGYAPVPSGLKTEDS